MSAPPPAVLELKRRLAEALVRSKLDYTNKILSLNAFLWDFRWEEGYTGKEVAARWRSLLRRPAPAGHFYSVYAHVPYCAKKCRFCYCATEISTNREVVDGYVPQLRAEIDFYAPLFKGREIPLLQVGGGTPSLLPARRLDELLSALTTSFRMAQDGLRVIEFNPASTDLEKLEIARARGFNRISFGVQSLDAAVLAAEGREEQTYEMTEAAVRHAQRLGFEAVNVDVMLGLRGETAESFLEGFERIAALRPTMIVVPGLSLTDAYLKINGLSREENLKAYEALLPRALSGLRRLCEKYGYDAGSLTADRHTWALYAKDLPAALARKLTRNDHLAGGTVSILGLGHHARSYLFGEAVASRYAESFAPDKPCYRLTRLTPKQEMMRYLIYAIESRSRVEFSEFSSRFGRDAREAFAFELKALAALGKARVDERGFDFLPVRGPERVFYGMFLIAEVVSESPFAAGRLDASFIRRLKKELEPLPLGAPA